MTNKEILNIAEQARNQLSNRDRTGDRPLLERIWRELESIASKEDYTTVQGE